MVIYGRPTLFRVEGHQLPECIVIFGHIVPNVSTRSSVYDINVLPNFSCPNWISTTINGCIHTEQCV